MSPITGIFGDHLKSVAARDGLDATDEDMELAGVVLSRACYALVRERSYPVVLLCGGARIPFDLTGLVGADLHVTINWKTFAEVLADPAPFSLGIDDPVDDAAVGRLSDTFADVRRALTLDGLTVDEFEGFGPVRHFRDNFIAGWHQVLDAIREERGALVR
jgi:transaldolase